MAIVDALLKIDDTDGNLKKITATEENYLAYRAGLQLAAAGTSEVASLNSSSGTTVGTYTDTQFDQAVGTHPGSSLTTTTTNTTIYQNSGTVSYVDSDGFRRPLAFETGGGFNAKEMPDSDLNLLVDELNTRIQTFEYPGTYRLASSTPGGDYTAALSNVFTDNRSDGTAVNYTVWKRTAMSAPTTTKYVRIKGIYTDETDLGESYDGLREASDAQINYTLGSVAQNRIMTSGVGTALLRSSADGAPSPGTWVSRGTALDTKQETTDDDYTRDSTRNSTRDSTDNFTRDSLVNYGVNYEGE